MTAKDPVIDPNLPARRDLLLRSPKGRTVLATIAQLRYSITHGDLSTPRYTDIIEQPDVLQFLIGEALSGWDYRLGVVDDELASFDQDIAQVAEELVAGSATHWWVATAGHLSSDRHSQRH